MPPSEPTDSAARHVERGSVTIGVVTALAEEAVAVKRFIEDIKELRIDEDPNQYHVGYLASSDRARPHRVALVQMPEDNTRNAAATCTELLRTFQGIRCVLMVGIAGGVPAPRQPVRHVRLGDVVVAIGGIVDYGHVRQVDGADVVRRSVDGMCVDLVRAVNLLRQGEIEGRPSTWGRLAPEPDLPLANFTRPPDHTDRLVISGEPMQHPDPALTGHRPGWPKAHYGPIGSGDVLMRDARRRDELAERYGILAVEMEGSGIAAGARLRGVQWFMVRGISDYCDEEKNDRWQRYASLMAASYTRTVLSLCRPFPSWPAAPRSGVLALVGNPERDDIIRLLSEIPGLDPRSLWHAAAGELAQLPEQPLRTIGDVFDHLSELNADDGLPPAVALLEEAAARADEFHARLLHRRAEALASRLYASEPLQRRRRKLTDAGTLDASASNQGAGWDGSARPCLVIQVVPDGIDARRCVTNYWIQNRSGPWQPEPGGEAVEGLVDALESVLEQFVQRAERAWRSSLEPIAIEFLLPTELLNMPVEWLSADLDSVVPAPLCATYEVVLRSLDRMRAEYHHRVWLNRWQVMWQAPGAHQVLWGDGSNSDLTHWGAHLQFATETGVVILSAAPDSEPGRRELGLALSAGVAVILWDRRGPVGADDRPTIRQLAEGDPGHLLQMLRQLRAEAATASPETASTHLGRHLAVLWDDPNRLIDLRGAGQ